MDYIVIAVVPVIPVVGVGLLAQRKRTLHITAGVMCAIGVFTGSPAFAITDALAVGLAWLLCASLREWPKQ